MASAALYNDHPSTQLIPFDSGWRAQIFTEWVFPLPILAAWDEMAGGYGDAGVFLETGWFEQWWSSMGQKGQLFVVVVERADRVQGIFPCWIGPEGGLRALADDFHYDFLVSREYPEDTVDRFIEVLRRANLPLPAYFQNFAIGSVAAPLLRARLRSRGIPTGAYSRPSAPYIDLSNLTRQTLDEKLHSKLKNNIRKGRKRAEREGDLSFAVVRRPDDLDSIITELFDVEFRSWKGQQGTAMKCVPEKDAFYRGIARWALTKEYLYIFTLRLNGQLIAFDFCIASATTMFALKTGYDQTVAGRFSAGNIMRYQLLEYLSSAGFARYDFLGPCYPWKLEWTSQNNTATSLEVYPRTPKGWYGYLRKYGWKAPLRRSQRLLTIAAGVRGRIMGAQK